MFDRCAYQNIYIYCCVLQTKHLFLSFESREVEESVYLATFYLWASAYSVMRAKRGNEEVEGDRSIGVFYIYSCELWEFCIGKWVNPVSTEYPKAPSA